MDLIACPNCGQPADIEWRTNLASTDGPVEHGKLRCLMGHVLFMPTEGLVSITEPADQYEPAAPGGDGRRTGRVDQVGLRRGG
jgi:hypothetical protein